MKRLLVLFAMIVPLSLFIAGCGGSGTSSGKSSEPTAEQKKEMQEKMQEKMKSGKMGKGLGPVGGAKK